MRFQFIMYRKHALSFGDSSSSCILNSPAHLAVPVHHVSKMRPLLWRSSYMLDTPPRSRFRSSYIVSTPPPVAISANHISMGAHHVLQTSPFLWRLRLITRRPLIWRFRSSDVSQTRPLIRRFRFIIYPKHALLVPHIS